MRKNRKMIIIPVCIVLFVALIATTISIDKNHKYKQNDDEQLQASLMLSPVGDVCLVNNVIKDWMTNKTPVLELYEEYREFGRLDYPIPVNIGFSVNDVPKGVSIEKQELDISENKGFSDPLTVQIPNHKNEIDVYNLKTGTTYYYRVKVNLSNGTFVEQNSTFNTVESPRYLYVDGVRNVRDIGGVVTTDGNRIKQGMLYRGTELDGAISEGKFVITEEGINTLQNVLKIKHQMDLRASNLENSKDSFPTDKVSHAYYTTFSYNETFKERGVKSLKKMFTDLADESKYPMYAHCTYGADRTGTMVYLMQAVLGVAEEQLYDEWELSVFFSGSGFYDEMDEFIKTLKSYEGNTMQEKVTNYLLSIGVTQQQIDSFRNIMLEKQ